MLEDEHRAPPTMGEARFPARGADRLSHRRLLIPTERSLRRLRDCEHGLLAECAPVYLQSDRQPVAIFSAWHDHAGQSCAIAPRHRPSCEEMLKVFPVDIDFGRAMLERGYAERRAEKDRVTLHELI